MTLTKATHYDVLIVGAGMVGASLALALQREQKFQLRILLVEASHVHRNAVAEQPGFDARSTVLSEGTARYFAELGLWQSIKPFAQPIRQIHVSDQGKFGSVRMNSIDEGVEALGHVVENASLGQAFNAALTAASALEVCSPAVVTHVRPVATGMQLSVQSAGNTADLTASLVVLAEGGRSGLCSELGISHRNCSYEQSGLIANVALSQAHRQIAYERFTPKGPLALLPLNDLQGLHRAALVWTHPVEEAQHMMDMEDSEFLQRLQQDFGHRAGRFIKVGKRTLFPLSLQLAEEQIRPGLVLLGNVAHALHPVAGQGFNLALRETMTLARNILESRRLGHSPGSFVRLQAYLQAVQQDQNVTISFSDYMTRLFSSNSRMLALVRQFGMASIDLLPPLKHQLSRQAMGLARPRVSL